MMNLPSVHTPLHLSSRDAFFVQPQPDVDAELGSNDIEEGRHGIDQSEVTALSSEDVLAVLARQTTASVTYALADGQTRTTRESYVLMDDVLYIPSSVALGSFIVNGAAASGDPHWMGNQRSGWLGRAIECEINELDGLSEWRYVWLRGCATLLHPTGGAGERNAWRMGIEQLRGVVPRLHDATIEDLAFSNFAVIRLANLEPAGVRLTLEGGMVVV